jgi:4-hydroxy-3-polyprenylbenzoate decarboxylase
MAYRDLREFLALLESRGELKRVAAEVDPRLEMTELCQRVLERAGPALLFERVKGHSMRVLGNLFGTPQRVALGMGRNGLGELRELGELLAQLREPEAPRGLREAWEKLPLVRQILAMTPRHVARAPCHEVMLEG